MAFNLLPAKWLNKRNDIAVKREDDQQHSMYSLQREMNRVFEDFFHSWEMPLTSRSFDLSALSTFQNSATTPRVDVHETEKELRVSAELPGMTEKDIDVSISKDALTISGEKKQEIEQNIKGWYRMERSYGVFMRSLPLPCEVDQDKCTASFKNGVLTVTLSKTPQAQASMKSIPIKKD